MSLHKGGVPKIPVNLRTNSIHFADREGEGFKESQTFVVVMYGFPLLTIAHRALRITASLPDVAHSPINWQNETTREMRS